MNGPAGAGAGFAVAGLTRDHDRLHWLGQLSAALAARLRACWPTLRPLPAPGSRPWD